MRTKLFTLSLAVILATGLTAKAADVSIASANGNAVLTVDPQSPRGVHSLRMNGKEQLKQQWFWYRLGTNGPQISIDQLSLTNMTLTSSQADFYYLLSNTFTLRLSFQLDQTLQPDFSTANLRFGFRVDNITGTNSGYPLDLHFFCYTDFDLAGNATNDTVVHLTANQWQQTDPDDSTQVNGITANPPTRWEMGVGPSILHGLTNGMATNLNDRLSPSGPADVAMALQWDRVMAYSGNASSLLVTWQMPIFSCTNFVPSLDPIGNVAIRVNARTQTVHLSGITSGHPLESGQFLTLTATSSDTNVIPDPVIEYEWPDTTATLIFTPLADASGVATIRVVVDDGGCVNNTYTNAVFNVTVFRDNAPPTLDPISDRTVDENSGPHIVSLTGISSGASNEIQTLRVTAVSADTALIPDPAIAYISPGTNGTLTFQPLPNVFGTTLITVTVNDGGASNNLVTRTFRITVRPLPKPPVVSIVFPTNGAVFIAPATFAIVAQASSSNGVVTNVQFFAQTNSLGAATNVPYSIIWSNVPVGAYDLTARAADNLGLAATSSVVRITVIDGPPVTYIGPLVLNRQTGLFDQTVRVSNPSPSNVTAIRLLLTNLPAGVRLWNATGTNGGLPFAQTDAGIAPGGFLDFHLEYYLTNRLMVTTLTNQTGVFNPGYYSRLVAAGLPPSVTNFTMVPSITKYQYANGNFLLEFSSLSNRLYYVQYSSNSVTWKTALPAVPGNGSRVQWIDTGPPKTDRPPALGPSRTYRVLLVP